MVQTTEQIVRIIESGNEDITSKMLADLIEDHRHGEGKRQKALWMRYTLEDAPIMHRVPANYEKVDRKIADDFYADVVDTKVGYMGNDVSVSLDKEKFPDEAEYNRETIHLDTWKTRANAEDINSEMVGQAAACGIGYRLLYIPLGINDIYIKNLPPWEVIYIYDQSIDIPTLAIRYYCLKSKEFGDKIRYKDITVVELYDDKGITYYIDDGDLKFHVDRNRGTDGYQEHMFDGIPIIPFPNNGLMTGEPEKALTLIDAYDAIISSTTSEIEQLRMAYMFVKGSGLMIDDKFMHQLEQTGIFPLDQDGEVGFVDKAPADTPVHNVLAEIRKNIYQFSKSIDMSKDFGGEMRVIGWQVALLNLENSCKITERKFIRALRKQYELMSDYWKTYQGVNIEVDRLKFTFTRNFPRDLKDEVETLMMLLTTVSKKKAFSLMSFIDDPEQEIAAMEEEGSPFREDVDEPEPEEK
jgi:SPP1 family phage portal protein